MHSSEENHKLNQRKVALAKILTDLVDEITEIGTKTKDSSMIVIATSIHTAMVACSNGDEQDLMDLIYSFVTEKMQKQQEEEKLDLESLSVDSLLDKISERGFESLSEEEVRFLKENS